MVLPTLVIVDGANVVGSVPDGWWRDRAGATLRLRDALACHGLPAVPGPVELVLVVEGAARGVPGTVGVRVVAAPGSGDDTIVALVRDWAAHDGSAPAGPEGDTGRRDCVVVTADRQLRVRVSQLGARCLGPGQIRR